MNEDDLNIYWAWVSVAATVALFSLSVAIWVEIIR
jgi:hypothetical protein